MADTTALSYWLNWRFFLCALWVLIAIIAAGLLIVKYEIFNKKRWRQRDNDADVEPIGILYEDETWMTSLKEIHPGWLLAYRLIAFTLLLALLISNLVIGGARVLFFYTQWTFALVTFYFGLASSFSIYGCYQYWNKVGEDNINHVGLDTEQGTFTAPLIEHSLAPQQIPTKSSNNGEINVRKIAGIWGYFFQIVFQICAGSVGLTDTVFWLIIYPYLTPPTYKLNFLNVSLHSINAVLLLIEVILNRLRFPFFRLAYFALWTCTFVIFQWILHACVSMCFNRLYAFVYTVQIEASKGVLQFFLRWPYAFLDLSSPYAPIWYFGVGLVHLPAFGIFALIVMWKQLLFSRFSQNLGASGY